MEMQPCSFGTLLDDLCHKKSFTRRVHLTLLSDLPREHQEVLLWRSRLNQLDDGGNICKHHEMMFGQVFERKSINCCDPFKRHKKKNKGSLKISLQFAKDLKERGFNVLPGWKLCRNCYQQILEYDDKSQSETSHMIDEEEKEEGEDVEINDAEISRDIVNTSLELCGVSPIKFHGIEKRRRVSFAKEKLNRVFRAQETETANAIGVDVQDLEQTCSTQQSNTLLEGKAENFDKLMYLLKEKLNVSSYREKLKILTLVPESWSRKDAARFFGVSEYLIRTARSLKETKGILADPEPKNGKSIEVYVEEAVGLFYEDDEYTRLLPGKKDFVSVGRNKHVQKRLLLCNLKELYIAFKQRNSHMKIGFSKFCSLHPKWCVPVGTPGSHAVCVCTYHQNAILLASALGVSHTYKDLMKMIVCDIENSECMIHRCPECPGTKPLQEFITAELARQEIDEIEYSQWQSTDRPTLITVKASTDSFLDTLVDKINYLTTHSFVAKCQSRFFKSCKENLSPTSCIVVLDFAENYKFVVQDEVQSFHWNNQQCTLHPVIIYHKDSFDQLKEMSLCVLSDDINHDTPFVHKVQQITTEYVKLKLPHIKEMHYFSDGCGGQYKNFKNFVNLCKHEDDFGLSAIWSFFATSHGKSSCDGLGGAIKRLTARASLQRPLSGQILNVTSMVEFCKEAMPKIEFAITTKEEMVAVRNLQRQRYMLGQTVPGTRSYHHFKPLQDGFGVQFKRLSQDDQFSGVFYFNNKQEEISQPAAVNTMDFIACCYDALWWIGLVEEIDNENRDAKVKFLHPHGPCKNFTWPARDDVCWVPCTQIMCKIEPPNTTSGRVYTISDIDFNNINRKFEDFLS